MIKNKFKESLFESTEKEDIQLLHYFIEKILSKFDSFGVNRFETLYSLYDTKTLKTIVEKLFRPHEKQIKESGQDEVESKKQYFGYWDDSYSSTKGKDYIPGELEQDTNKFCKKNPSGRRKIYRILYEHSRRINNKFQIQNSNKFKKIYSAFKTLGIRKESIEFILFLYIRSKFLNFNEWIARSADTNLIPIIVREVTGLSRYDYLKVVNKEEPLAKFGIIHISKDKDDPCDISDFFFNFLNDETQETFGLRYLSQLSDEAHPISSYFMAENEVELIISLLKDENPAKILFYGSPGTGKTEFAKSLVAELKKTLFKINNNEAECIEEKRTALIVGTALSAKSDCILLFDEADDILNEGGGRGFLNGKVPEKKIWMNEFLDQMNGKLIFITNESSSIHESVLRRFDYSLEFFPAEHKRRLYYWNRILKLENVDHLLDNSQIDNLAYTYPASVGGISIGIKAAKKICNQRKEDTFVNVIKDVMNKHTKLTRGSIKKVSLSSSPYDSKFLHVDSKLEDLDSLINEYKRKLKESDTSNIGSLCLLFYGKPGTGKTEYVKYIAQKFNLELMQKRGSDIQSPYIGVSEQLIAQAFQEAESNKSIFFLDEADSFFRSRELAVRSWEVTQTNEFLTWMESFRGIFIASTNFMKDFDQAALRRFAWKGEFKSLRRDDKVEIVIQYFPNLTKTLTFLEKENIKEIPELTVGDIRAVWNRFRFRDPKKISGEEIIQSLKNEVSYKLNTQLKSIGF
ncbi:AAA family ATPase [Leptospira levettii]|uniref:ATP-binding protein n=1 Tax=Leptospira levettii TaxID=2023178 RepID=A0AAW5VDW2_9LEPT|nr:ATP-binding protein [Leptospira levettii]MCW7467664.1 ATP-binding protein [Leptospira levettii]MCW7513344.1 ATP-binding protein [Leptospira levettii]MCW7517067.1 ATP-binding protein [Leptospira levettii]